MKNNHASRIVIEKRGRLSVMRHIMVLNAKGGSGKTTIATNLAAIISKADKRVALLDADLRRPHIHSMFGMSNRDGLSDLFRKRIHPSSVGHTKLDLPHLMILTSGTLPPNPTELLGSDRMDQILDELYALVDMVVIDTPPSIVADAQALAAKVDAVLIVVQPGVTHMQAAQAMMDTYKRAGVRVVGVVLNRIPRNRNYYYGGYQYYSPYVKKNDYYHGDESKPAEQPQVEQKVYKTEMPAPSSYLSRLSKISEESEEIPEADPYRH